MQSNHMDCLAVLSRILWVYSCVCVCVCVLGGVLRSAEMS